MHGTTPYIPTANAHQKGHRHQGGDRKPRDARLSVPQDNERGKQWAKRGPEVAANLEEGLGKAVTAA